MIKETDRELFRTEIDKFFADQQAQVISCSDKKNYFFTKNEMSLYLNYEVDAFDRIDWKREGIQHKKVSQLKTTKVKSQGILDLHGDTVEMARDSVYHFLNEQLLNQNQVVLIIHGKGAKIAPYYAILKSYVWMWLKALSVVLAFVTPSNQEGGAGVTKVLLKRMPR